MFKNFDETYMRLAIDLAKRGIGKTSPNPIVGAVIVKDNQIIAKGWHEKYGQAHAEVNALSNCQVSPKGATMYVTLEPCCHWGKQPPCTSKIIESGVSHVVIGSSDPNPQVSGKGVEILKNNGIKVTESVLKRECDELNTVFFHYIKNNIPYVILKYAMTADGKIATYTGASKWITGKKAREQVHRDRNRYSAIMVGVGTVIEDNPMLNCRIEDGNNPLRIICDTNLRTPLNSNVVKTAGEIPTIIATASKDYERWKEYEAQACSLLKISNEGDAINLADLMKALGQMKIDSVIVEGGAQLNWSILKASLMNKIQVYVGAKLFGGVNSKTPISGEGIALPNQSVKMKLSSIRQFDDDCLLEYEVYKED
jgi:riboflavin biosynthesis protein ribD